MLSWEEAKELIQIDEISKLLKNIIRIPSIGARESDVAYEIINVLEAEDIHDFELIESEEGRGNLIIDINGKRGKGFNLLLLGHSDVVPPGNNWSIDPFSGIEKDGYIYGRGALDNKSQIAVYTYLAVLLSRINYSFRGNIRIIIAADEEIQSKNHGIRFLVREHPRIFKHIHGAVGELGGLIKFRGNKGQAVIIGEKGTVSYKVVCRGNAGHTGIIAEDKYSPLRIGSEFVLRLPSKIFFISKTFKDVLEETFGWKIKLLMNRFFINKLSRNRGDSFSRYLVALSHIILSKTMIRAGDAHNVLPDYMEITVNARIFPEQDDKWVERLLKTVLSQIATDSYELTLQTYVPATISPTNTLLFKKITDTIKQIGYNPIPTIQPGSSDSSWLRSLGIPTYHFFITSKEIEIDRIHGADERIWKQDLMNALEGYYRLIEALQKA